MRYKGQVRQLRLIVVEGNGPTLLGRNWLKYLKLDWPQILHVAAASQLDKLLREYGEIFKDELGTLKTFKATRSVKPGAAPKFFRPRSVPFAIRDAVGKELDRLEAVSILEKVSYSEWAAPIVTVPKKDGTWYGLSRLPLQQPQPDHSSAGVAQICLLTMHNWIVCLYLYNRSRKQHLWTQS